MIELATIKAVVDLFKDLVGLFKQQEKDKREAFERTCKPLYDRLEVVFKQYYAIIAKTARRLEEADPNIEAILRELNEERDGLVIARNGILGEANAFLAKYATVGPAGARILAKARFSELVRSFTLDILQLFEVSIGNLGGIQLFDVSNGDLRGMPKGRLLPLSAALSLKEIIELDLYDGHTDFRRARDYSKYVTQELERRWQSLSQHFFELKLYCEE